MKEFVKDKPDFIKRLEYLCAVVLEPGEGRRRKDRLSGGFRGVHTRAYGAEEKKRKREDGTFEDIPLVELDFGPRMKLNLNFKASTREVDRDAEGKPRLPIMAKGATILNLGTVVYDRSNYWSRNYIWPVGFKSSRKLPSIKNSGEYVTYYSEITDGGNSTYS